MMLAPVLTPHGLLMLVQSLEAEGEAPALEPEHALRLEKAFARGAGHGLVLLGADEVGTTLSPTLSYWRKLGARYMTALCAPSRLPACRLFDDLNMGMSGLRRHCGGVNLWRMDADGNYL